MRKAIVLVAILTMVVSANATIIISELVDATLPFGLPKYVELTNTGTLAIDLGGYYIGNINNGSPESSFAATQLSGTLEAGDSYVISYEDGDSAGVGTFYDTYGFDPDFFDTGSWINGDDVIALYFGDPGNPHNGSTAVDVYGVVGVDGTGEVWEYTDSYAFRKPTVTSTSNPFDALEWILPGANSLETGNDVEELALILSSTSPGTHTFVPEPATMFLLGVGGLFLRRRK